MKSIMQYRGYHWILFLLISFPAIFVYLHYLDVGLFERGGAADNALTAKKLLEKGEFDAWYHPPLSYIILGLSFVFGGYTEFAARFGALIFFVICGGYTFKLGQRLISTSAGLLASYLYFFSPFFVLGIFTYWLNIILMTFMVASVYYVWCYATTKKERFLFFGGVFAGSAILTKETALLLFPIYYFVLRKDARLIRLLSIMFFFTGLWLVSYELLFTSAYKYALLQPIKRLILEDATNMGTPSLVNLFWFAEAVGPVIFGTAIIGAGILFLRKPNRTLLPFLVSLIIIVLFSVSKTKHLKYFFPAVPFMLIFAATVFVEFFAFARKRLFFSLFAVFFGAYILGTYTLPFFNQFEEYSLNWVGSPKFALRGVIENHTKSTDSLLVVDDNIPEWIEFYTGRKTHYYSVKYSDVVPYPFVRDLSPPYLVVRVPPGINESIFENNCKRLEIVAGREYNYTTYKCAWD